jgi:hypothetical protein
MSAAGCLPKNPGDKPVTLSFDILHDRSDHDM